MARPRRRGLAYIQGTSVNPETRGCPTSSEGLEQGYRPEEKRQERGSLCAREASANHRESEFQSLCDVPDEGTFMAQRRLWQKMERGWSIFRMEDCFSLVGATILHNEDTRTFAPKDLRGRSYVQSKISFFQGEQNKKGSSVQVEVGVETDEQVERLVRCTYVLHEHGGKQQFCREVIRTVSEGTSHRWSKMVGSVESHVQEEAYFRSEVKQDRVGWKGKIKRRRKRLQGLCMRFGIMDCVAKEYSKRCT